MKFSASRILAVVALATLSAVTLAQPVQTVTLVPPVNPVTKKYSEDKSCFNFKMGLLKEPCLKKLKGMIGTSATAF